MSAIDDIIKQVQTYNPEADAGLIKKAHEFSEGVHRGQKRSSGEPYLVHPVQVAALLAQLKLDVPSVVAGLLHDTVEDTLTTLDEVRRLFGDEIAELVDGVTKLSRINFSSKEEKQAENFRKMIVAMARDIRVILIKLADRVHNMRTLDFLSEERRLKIAQETIDIYAPLAHRLGIHELRVELEDLSFRALKPGAYQQIVDAVKDIRKKSEGYLEEVRKALLARMTGELRTVEIYWRYKNYWSLYRKMERQNVNVEQIYDILGFRVIVDSLAQCYEMLGLVHSVFRPVPGHFKDYIGMPKTNNYQSLHTAVIGPKGTKIEFQIRTREMHEIAEWGIAAHWSYKHGTPAGERDEMKFRWLRQLLEWQREMSDPAEFLDSLKLDLFAEEVYIFTPKGDLKVFPIGATPVDFAYAIHTDVGHKCSGARVNGRMVPLKYKLRSGDSVEIITQAGHHPSKDWLKLVQTSSARAKIRSYVRVEERERSRQVGRDMLEKECVRCGLVFDEVFSGASLQKLLEKGRFRGLDHVCALIGYGKVSPKTLLAGMFPKEQLLPVAPREESMLQRIFKKVSKKSRGLVTIDGLQDVLVTFGRCCNPLPGESVVGFVTRGRGVTVHAVGCSKAITMDPERQVTVKWNQKADTMAQTRIRVIGVDRPGLLASLSQTIAAVGVNISGASIRTLTDEKAVNTFEVEVKDLSQLNAVVKKLEKIDGVISVERVRGNNAGSA